MIGFIKLPREILEWEWYSHPTAARLYIHLILKANYMDKKWQGTLVKRGQLITSTKHLVSELGLSIQQIRTALEKLKSSNDITCRSTNSYTLITVVEYNAWQSSGTESNTPTITPATYKKHSPNIPLTTTKEGKEIYKNIEERKEDFKKQVFKHSQFQDKILNGFYNYWTEVGQDKKTLRFESQAFFEIGKRLKSWSEKEKNWYKKDAKNKNTFSTNR